VGAILALIGVGCMGSGAALGVAVGTDGWIESDYGPVDTTTHALVSEVADIADEDPDAAEFFDEVELKLRVNVEADAQGDEVFVGVGRSGDVDAYLADVEHEVVNDVITFQPLELDKTIVPGGREPGPPRDETFWVEQVSGSGLQILNWDIEAGSYRFVVMNVDGSAGLEAQSRLALKIPYVTAILIALFVAGGLILVLGIVIIVLTIRSGRGKAAPPTATEPAAHPPETDSTA
jgi:hypothetical protein